MSTQSSELWTAESVSEGHPDKVADAISDAIVDELLKLDPYIRVAAETFVTNASMAILGGEIGIPQDSKVRIGDINYVALVREVANRIGYTETPTGFDGQGCVVLCGLKAQSANIARGVLQA
jgi:S-adenosylmethionine synthetase